MGESNADLHQHASVCIRSGLPRSVADELSLVLAAMNISHRIAPEHQLWNLWVAAADAEGAEAAVAAYESENPPAEDDDAPVIPAIKRNWAGAGLALFLLTVHAASYGDGDHGAYVRTFGASAEAILSGELYRTVTALVLHDSWQHLAGNMVGCIIFATAVCAWIGSGVGVLLILASGVLGNWISAAVYESRHMAIGASTAVFGALGLIAAHQFVVKIRHPKQRLRAWLPLAGAIALLGFLGVSDRSDILAHFFGLVTGIGIGAAATLMLSEAPGEKVQNGCMVLSLIVVILAWIAGIG